MYVSVRTVACVVCTLEKRKESEWTCIKESASKRWIDRECLCASPFCLSFSMDTENSLYIFYAFVGWLSRDLRENVRNRFSCCYCCCFSCSCFLWCWAHFFLSFFPFFETVRAGASMSETQIGTHAKHSMRRGVCTCILQKINIFNNGAICFGSFASIDVFFRNHQITTKEKRFVLT